MRGNKIKMVGGKDFIPFHLWLIKRIVFLLTAAAYLPLSIHPCIIFIYKKGLIQTECQSLICNQGATHTLWIHDTLN